MIITKSNRLLVVLKVIYSILLLAWVGKVFKYYFDFVIVDNVGLVVATAISFGVSSRLQWSSWLNWVTIIIASVTPLLVYPVTSELISHINSADIVLYVALIVAIFAINSLKKPQLALFPVLMTIITWLLPYKFTDAQRHYFDRVAAEHNTRKGTIHFVKWKNDYWLYYNNHLQYSTLDGHMYAEAYVHPAMNTVGSDASVLLIGGDNRILINELSKYENIDLTIIPYDQEFATFMQNQDFIPTKPVNSLQAIKSDPFSHLSKNTGKYSLIIVDMLEGSSPEFNQFYTEEFYSACYKALAENGKLVTQAGNLILNKDQLLTIQKTLNESGFNTLPYHAQVPTIGEWSWVLASKTRIPDIDLQNMQVQTKWLDQDAMNMMLAFGKMDYFPGHKGHINTIKQPVFTHQNNPKP